MLILHSADIHFRKTWFAYLAREATKRKAVLALSGDLLSDRIVGTRRGTSKEEQIEWVAKWVERYEGELVLSSGNHDLDPLSDRTDNWLRSLARPNVTVDGQSKVIDGVRFACVPFFHPMRAQGIGARAEFYAGAQVLLHHEPPFLADTTGGGNDNAMSGSIDLDDYLAITPTLPQIVLSGHVHAPRNWFAYLAGNRTVNFNPGYSESRSIPRIVTIDTSKNLAYLNTGCNPVVKLPIR